MKKQSDIKSDFFFNSINLEAKSKRSLATEPFMPHLGINYIIPKQGKETKDFFPCFIDLYCTYKFFIETSIVTYDL